MIKKNWGTLSVFLLLIILTTSAVLMLNASKQEAAIMDELAHIPAGYSYVKYLDFRLNPEHPPLIKALSTIPLLGMDLKFPTNEQSWTSEINDQWNAGNQFLYESGNNTDKMIFWSRIFPILLTLLTTLLIYIWSRELLGNFWALIPAFFFGLSPTVLAHGHYVTTDIGATFGVILAAFFFIKFLQNSSTKNLIFSGLTFGIAELTKFSNALLIPYFFIIGFIFLLSPTKKLNFFRFLLKLISIFIIGYILVYLVYFVLTFNYPHERQISDSEFILASFTPTWLRDIGLSIIKNPVSRPFGEYILGLFMVLQRSAGGNTGYFLGEVSASGWWYYFPTVFLLKEPLPSLLLILFALGSGILLLFKKLFGKKPNLKNLLKDFQNYIGVNFAEFSMLLFIIIYWAYSIKSPLNIGVRHLMPTLPFIYILITNHLKNWIRKNFINLKSVLFSLILSKKIGFAFKQTLQLILKFGLLIIIILWYFGETITASPHFLSYFNEIGGGTKNGYKYVTDSNYDWGQDLKELKNFAQEKNISKIAVDYFGGGNPKYYLGEKYTNWSSNKGNPKDKGIEWLAVSINTIQSAIANLHPGQERNPQDEYQWLQNLKPKINGKTPEPDYKAGTSIFIYRL